jgi:hypothetical protein
MYEYRILFPRLASNEIRRQLSTRPTTDARAAPTTASGQGPRTRKERF